MPRQRVHLPEFLPGAGDFSGKRQLGEAVQLIRQFKETRWLSRGLIEETSNLGPGWGRPRIDGKWILVALAFVLSPYVDIEPFWTSSSNELWRVCGFTGPKLPSYATTHARLTELERAIPQVDAASQRLIRHCARHDPRIGRHMVVDGSEADTHARLIHDCREGEYCAWRRPGEDAESLAGPVTRVPAEVAAKWRQAADRGMATYEEIPLEPVPEREADPPAASSASTRRRPRRRIRTANHSWLTHDPDAGVRSYRSKTGIASGWHGFYSSKATDAFTGLPLNIRVYSNSVNENLQYPDLMEGTIAAINPPASLRRRKDVRVPEAVIADSGLGYPHVYEWNTVRGIATVTPWRNLNDGRVEPTDLPFVDRHGVLRCRFCKGPGKFLELRRGKHGTPRVYFSCGLPAHPESSCATTVQSVACSKDWRLVTPLWQDDVKYFALRNLLWPLESAHHHSRTRNRVAGKSVETRPKRLGRDWQQLRASVSVLLDWFRAAIQQGWLASSRRAWRGYSEKTRLAMAAWRDEMLAKALAAQEALRETRHRERLDSSTYPVAPQGP